MKMLITGAGGYLGKGLILPLAKKHELRLMDRIDFDTTHPKVVGDVGNLDTVCAAVRDMDALVIAHMASRQSGAYTTPEQPFDANVKGTANLFFAAQKAGVSRACLISSHDVGRSTFQKSGVVKEWAEGNDIYVLTKACQELVARHYHKMYDIPVRILRIGWVIDNQSRIDKYGKPRRANPDMIDPRDVGEAVRLALEWPDPICETFYVRSTVTGPEDENIRARLGWTPKFTFL